jgi:hypothetical protein
MIDQGPSRVTGAWYLSQRPAKERAAYLSRRRGTGGFLVVSADYSDAAACLGLASAMAVFPVRFLDLRLRGQDSSRITCRGANAAPSQDGGPFGHGCTFRSGSPAGDHKWTGDDPHEAGAVPSEPGRGSHAGQSDPCRQRPLRPMWNICVADALRWRSCLCQCPVGAWSYEVLWQHDCRVQSACGAPGDR